MTYTREDMEEFAYHDTLVQFHSAIQQYGIEKVLQDFQKYYPKNYQVLKESINYVEPKPIAALLRE